MENSKLREISEFWLKNGFLEKFRKIGERKQDEIMDFLETGSCAENSKEHKQTKSVQR